MTERAKLIEAHREAAAFYRRALVKRPSWPVEYLRTRRLDHVLAFNSSWPVGYAPDAWSGLIDHLRRKGFDDNVLLDAGLAKVTHNGYMIDQFKDRLMFVAHDRASDGVGFVGRGRGQLVKYLNTPTTPIYEKSKTLVGLGEQRKLLARGGIPVLVEGPTDALAIDWLSRLTRCGWAGLAVAGTRLSVEQSNLVRHGATSDIVIVATDGDAAGRSAAIRWLAPLSATFREVLCAELPAGHDPSSLFASEYGADRLSRALSFARPLVDVAIDTELSRWSRVLDHINGRVSALRAVLPLVTKMPKDRVAGEVIRLSRLLQLDEQTVSRELLTAVSAVSRHRAQSGSASPSAVDHPPPSPDL
ncbi:toprim domain-containing protein [Kribbella qitaiheensis]|uniref:toprim domain-containing protein n=1 Tax=Kribbella qitaiheensis TaxID=1544730 RepID=UPI00361BA926